MSLGFIGIIGFVYFNNLFILFFPFSFFMEMDFQKYAKAAYELVLSYGWFVLIPVVLLIALSKLGFF